ncbi:PLP-dependent aminotransferase family protein [Chryseobacterium sp. Mn2064]|uniref:MocR-like pyridoxine biosynthesis transcription factor PdxR n=1 Tax=Chryseobacterium sp. Mn2064 TaxID=3395263 RepID=UPI003BD8BFAF
MKDFQDFVIIDKSSDTPVYLQITDAIIQQIKLGRLREGRKMPGSRQLANLLAVNRMTVVAAYNELEAQGWMIQHSRKGSFVHNDLPLLQPKLIAETGEIPISSETNTFSFNNNLVESYHDGDIKTGQLVIDDGFPDPRLAPIEELTRAMKMVFKRPGYIKYLNYGSTKGSDVLRRSLAAHLNDTRGLPVTENNVLVTRGATMGIYLTARIIAKPGDEMIMSEPGFHLARKIFEQLELNINKVPVDEQGIDVERIEKICKTKKISFIYVVPHHHFPTTVTLSLDRRIRLLELSHQYNFVIIEDDYDYDFHYASNPIMPMASIDTNGKVIYIGTLTKTLVPSIRIGFLSAHEDFVEHAASYRHLIDFQGDGFLEVAIAELYRDGTMVRHIKKSVKTYRERRDHFCELLKKELGEKVQFTVPNGGMSVWVKFENIDLKKLSEKARSKGLEISDGSKYDSIGNPCDALRLGFASLNYTEQTKAIEILKTCL